MSRHLPHDAAAEASVLGAVLLRNSVLPLLLALTSEQFYDPRHGFVWSAIRELDRKARPIDEITLEDELRKAGKLDAVGGLPFLSKLTLAVPTADNVQHYADIVRNHHRTRSIMLAASEIQAAARDVADPGEFAADAIARIAQAAAQGEYRTAVAVGQTHREYLAELNRRTEDGTAGHDQGVPTGFAALDERVGRLQPNRLTILAARPAMGKTSLAVAIMRHAHNAGYPVLFFSAEMSRLQIHERMVCQVTGSTAWQAQHYALEVAHVRQLIQRRDEFDGQSAVDDTARPTIGSIRAEAHRFKAATGAKLGLVIGDYLQLFRVAKLPRGAGREREIAEISAGLKSLAKELAWPVLALCQLNRNLESRTQKRPQLSDLRESGAIEQDADMVTFLYRDVVYDPDSDPHEAELIVAKNRFGPTGTVKIGFHGPSTSFHDLEVSR